MRRRRRERREVDEKDEGEMINEEEEILRMWRETRKKK